MKITTKTGDRGHSGLYGGARAPKSSLVFDVLGDLDELCSTLGWMRGPIDDERHLWDAVEALQGHIYKVMSIVGFEGKVPEGAEGLEQEDLDFLEAELGRAVSAAHGLRQFVKPGTTEAAGRIHMARCVCRRAERALVRYHETVPMPELVLKYVNRLSDLLYVWALKFEKTLEKL